jgi:hypothetical protein
MYIPMDHLGAGEQGCLSFLGRKVLNVLMLRKAVWVWWAMTTLARRRVG